MIKKLGTILCIFIVILGFLQNFYKSTFIAISVAVLFPIFQLISIYDSVKSKEKIRSYGLIGLTIVFGIILLNYLNII